MKNNPTLLLAIIIFQFSCSQAEEIPYVLPQNAKFLLAGDSTKTWKLAQRFNNETRMNMGDCFLLHRETYKVDLTMKNNSGQNPDCGDTLNAEWKFVKDKKGHYYIRISSQQLPKLMNIEEDFKLFKVLHLSEEQMTLEFYHQQFSDKTTKITDTFVPEFVSVDNREFHW